MSIRKTIGPVAIAAGGTAALVGAVLPWAVVHYSPRFLGIQLTHLASVTRRVPGTDLTEGKVALVVAATLVVFGVAALVVKVAEWVTDFTLVGALGGGAALAVGVYAAMRIRDVTLARYNPFPSNRPLGEVHLRQLVTVSRGSGLVLVIAGAVVASIGSIMALVLSRNEAKEDTVA